MSTYNDNLTLQARQLTQDDYDTAGGEMLLCRAYMSPTRYSFVPGDFLCQRMVGDVRDGWIVPNAAFSTAGWFAVSPPDSHGFVVYGGLRTCDVSDLDNGFFACSVGCMVDDDTFWASHTLNTP